MEKIQTPSQALTITALITLTNLFGISFLKAERQYSAVAQPSAGINCSLVLFML
uniref:Uncharacterized protein n=1 Tax=uncultured Desulfobacterium sp. TaxID=201089 RepID=E1YEB5_9BACT|nr:unknown protein [uncultured Desulfobacterium sp.]